MSIRICERDWEGTHFAEQPLRRSPIPVSAISDSPKQVQVLFALDLKPDGMLWMNKRATHRLPHHLRDTSEMIPKGASWDQGLDCRLELVLFRSWSHQSCSIEKQMSRQVGCEVLGYDNAPDPKPTRLFRCEGKAPEGYM